MANTINLQPALYKLLLFVAQETMRYGLVLLLSVAFLSARVDAACTISDYIASKCDRASLVTDVCTFVFAQI